MENAMIAKDNPTSRISVSFPAYVEKRKLIESGRMDGHGLPNYAFALDYELRKKLDSIPGFYKTVKLVCDTVVSQQTQLLNINAIKVGPTQFPDVYQIGCDCARTLGIGIPNMFIVNDPTMNAYTYAYDDLEPIVVIHSGLYERLTPGELRCVIGHECGHIQNQHGIYQIVANILLNVGTYAKSTGVTLPVFLGLTGYEWAVKAWDRAAEVTCDRAGMICAENIRDAYSVNAKLLYGAAFGDQKIDLSAIQEQLDNQMGNISKYYELYATHPSSARRIKAEQEFSECEILYQWRPDLRTHGQIMRSKQETDERCRKFIDLTKNG